MRAGIYTTRDAMPGGSRGFSIIRFMGFLVLFALAACQTFPQFTVEPLPRYEALFQHPSGWTGGDGAYSTALGSNRFLWLFGDTLVGEIKKDRRIIAAMVPNSIAIQMGNEPQAVTIDFFPDGGSAPFLKPEDGKGAYHLEHDSRAGADWQACRFQLLAFFQGRRMDCRR